MARRMDQHVLEFQVAMHDAVAMEMGDGLGDFRDVKRGPMFVEAPPVLLQ